MARPGAARRAAATSGSSRSRSGPATRSASSRRRRPSARASRSSSTRGSSTLPLWRLPAASVEGSHAAPERTLQTTPLATPSGRRRRATASTGSTGESTARHGEIQVKEFELEQTADAWIFLDLERSVQGGRGDESTVEMAVRAAASIADKALLENRAVGHDGQRPSAWPRPGRPRRPAAPEDHAAARRGRRRRHDPARRVADRRRRTAPPRDDRDHHHAVHRPCLDPAHRRTADAGDRVGGRHPRRRGRRTAGPRDPAPPRRDRRRADDRGRGAASPAGAGPPPRDRRVRAARSISCRRAGRSPRPSADDGPRPLPDRERPAGGLADAPARRAPRGVRRVVARRRGPRPRPARLDGLPRRGRRSAAS